MISNFANVALPLELTDFSGETLDNSNMLHWETATERNVANHILERAADGEKWSEIGRRTGQANSFSTTKYTLEDKAPLAKSYYRLRSVDFDGTESFSNIVILTRKDGGFGITTAFPSPTTESTTIKFNTLTEDKITVKVVDVAGRTVAARSFDANKGLNEYVLDMSDLQVGTYFVSLQSGEQVSEPFQIVKI